MQDWNMSTVIIRTGFALLSMLLCLTEAAGQNCFWSSIDHKVGYEESGIWNPSIYRHVLTAATVANFAGAIWEGSETRLGKTMWQSIDSWAIANVTAEAGKRIFSRVRPSTQDNPCLWFKGDGNTSFPSGESAMAAGLVTPYVLEYGKDHPATYGLLLLPLYVGLGRIKNQDHWQTDVLAGWAIGGLAGWYAHSRETPFFIEILPDGFAVGLKVKF